MTMNYTALHTFRTPTQNDRYIGPPQVTARPIKGTFAAPIKGTFAAPIRPPMRPLSMYNSQNSINSSKHTPKRTITQILV